MTEETPYDRVDESMIPAWDKVVDKKAILQQEEVERRIYDDIKTVLGTASGRRLLWHLINVSGLFKAAYLPQKPELTSYLAGRQSIGQYIWEVVESADKGLAKKLMNENIGGLLSYGNNFRLENTPEKKGGRSGKRKKL